MLRAVLTNLIFHFSLFIFHYFAATPSTWTIILTLMSL